MKRVIFKISVKKRVKEESRTKNVRLNFCMQSQKRLDSENIFDKFFTFTLAQYAIIFVSDDYYYQDYDCYYYQLDFIQYTL